MIGPICPNLADGLHRVVAEQVADVMKEYGNAVKSVLIGAITKK